MKAFEASSFIKASPERIWSILTDATGYVNWDSSVARIDGRIGAGGVLTLESKAVPGRMFRVKVSEFDAPHRMVWSGGMPIPGLFRGVRTFTLTPEEDGTRYSMREEYTGLLMPMIGGSIPDLSPSFQQWAAGLKQEAERRAASG